MTVSIVPSDLFLVGVDEKRATATIDTVIARAQVFAPCLADAGFLFAEAAKGILVDVVQRKLGPRPGVTQSETAGGRTQSTTVPAGPPVLFWPEEIAELQALCRAATSAAGSSTGPVGSFPDALPWPV